MKTIIGFLAAMLLASSVLAGEIVGSYDYYLTPNEGNTYDDGQGVSIGYDHAVRGPVRGQVFGTHITDIHFPVIDDPKGSFGELRSYGLGYKVYVVKKYNDKLRLNAGIGVAYHDWDFRENPFLQDNKVKVSVDNSISYAAYVGADYAIKPDWKVFVQVGWFDTAIDKEAVDDTGRVWNILDANELNLRYITGQVGAKVEF